MLKWPILGQVALFQILRCRGNSRRTTVTSLTVSQVGQNFTFVLTDIDSKQRFGFCRLSSGAKSCFCILSYLPWFEVFYKLLNILADYTTKGQESQWNELLDTLHRLPIPDPGMSVHLSVHSYFTVPDTRELPSIPENRNLTEYFVAVDVNNMLHLYASMLHERRILIICSKLSTLTACVHGSAAMLYPMFWQHVYIPVLPPHLLDYCCAPMPYLIGIHLSLMEKVRNMALDDVVILNVDTNTLETPFDDLQSLPNDVISALKNRLKKVSTTTGDGVARAFLKAQAAFFGSYRNALKIEPEEPITFCEEAFVSHYRSGAMRQFLQNATQLQLFKQFIDGRLDLLNSGEGFSDVFEEEINMGEYAGSDKLYHQWLSTVRKGSGAILNTVKTKANPAMKTVYKFAKDHAKMGIKEVKNRLKQKDIAENGCAPTMEEQLPKTAPSPLVEAKDPKLREDRRPITVHFGQPQRLRPTRPPPPKIQRSRPVRPPRPHVVKRPKSNVAVEGRRTSVSSPEHLVKPLRHYAVFLSEDSSDDECQREEGPSSGFTESLFFSAPFEWPQPYRTLKESDSAEGDEAESPEQRAREPAGPAPAPPDRAASIDLLEDVFGNLDVEVPLQPLGQAKSLEDLRTPKDLREQPGTFDYQRLDLGRSERSRGMPAALKLAHPYNKLWSLGQDDMAICSKPLATSPEKPSLLLGNSLAFPRKPQNRDSILKSGDKEVAPTPALGSITIPRPQGRKTPELGIVPPPPTARPAKLPAAGAALGDFSSEWLQAEQERRTAPGFPQGPTELLQPLGLTPGTAATDNDALLALLDPLNTAWSGSTLPLGPRAPNVATPFTPQFSFAPAGTPSPFPQPSLNPFVPSMPAALPAMSLVSAAAGPFGAPPASLGPALAPSFLLSGSGFCAPHRAQPSLSALSMPNLFGQMPMGAHTSPLQPLGPMTVAPSRIRTLPLVRSSARAAEAKQGLSLRPGDPQLLPPKTPQGLEPALQPSATQEARDPFEDLLRKTKQDVSPAPAPALAPAPAPGSVEQLRKQWETFE
ncbi:DENN domain-containing protein 1A isoform X4 [Rousettus aegyptiacus]|uniref:DENN domain-containing protein 1A isoform X4 n=1 Tax=Rousettus aegyptiacus TaxID=9407 RepID=UPI00168CCD66|nr:DENN domain-containing protein 1A isoform X4 [Rousettus aegyptiacus]